MNQNNPRKYTLKNGGYIQQGTEHDVQLIDKSWVTVSVKEIREEGDNEFTVIGECDNISFVWKRIKDGDVREYDVNDFIE